MRWFYWTVEEFEELKNPVNCKMVILLRNQLGKYELTSSQLRTYPIQVKIMTVAAVVQEGIFISCNSRAVCSNSNAFTWNSGITAA